MFTFALRGDVMFSVFLKIFGFFMSLWSGLSEAQKDKIISIIVDSFEVFLRKYFQAATDEADHG